MTEVEQNKLIKLFHSVKELRTSVETRLNRDEKFNVMTILRKETDERYLHSRFIASVLDPKAPHRMQYKFLKLFLETIGCDDFIKYNNESLKIIPNYRNSTEKDNIDILLEDESLKKAVIIENKINASDQQGQLLRYFIDRMKKLGYINDLEKAFENIKIFYLAPI